MKIDYKLFALLGAVFITASFTISCVNSISDEEPAPSDQSEQIQVRISSPIEEFFPLSRMTGTDFENNDAIGVYLVKQPGTLSGERHLGNVRFVCTAGEFNTTPPVYYPYGEGKYDFYSYYPYRKDTIVAGESKLPVTVKVNQGLLSDYLSSDFLAAFKPGVTPSNAKIELPHYHKMCKLEVEVILKGTEGVKALIDSKPIATLLGLYTSAKYDFVKDTITSLAVPQDISLYGEWAAKGDTLVGKSAVLIPQTVVQGSKLLKFQVGERNFSANLPSDFLLQSGTICKLKLAYDSKIGIKKMGVIIEPWDVGQEMETEVVEDGEDGFLSISESDFRETSVLDVISHGKTIAVVCKEYLRLKDAVDAQAIVIYPMSAGAINLKGGRVMSLIGRTGNSHGGSVSWNESTNSLTYIPGTLLEYHGVYVTEKDSISFEKPKKFLLASLKKRYLKDVRGNESINYPIVKIGTQCWMQSNLRAQKYAPGNIIALLDNKAITKGCRVNGKDIYYNMEAVKSGELAPQNWRISTTADWDTLLTYLGNSTQALKSQSLWQDATNLTGFNCELIGYYATGTNQEHSFHTSKESFTVYWLADTDKMSSVFIQNSSGKVAINKVFPLYGLSVRCVGQMF